MLKLEIRALAVLVVLGLPFTTFVGAATISFGDAVGLWVQACGAEVPKRLQGHQAGQRTTGPLYLGQGIAGLPSCDNYVSG
ncbi:MULTISPECIES: hypothetical protein [unclassified Mesorhizobium]|uniref:hypothetical protein n=1 Tax=unclassified Mesorhizobium TaxID=325217 RepID=UPI0015E3FAEC|nr:MULTISPECIES: hypothetical protein [unclassified Mesorhizobium]